MLCLYKLKRIVTVQNGFSYSLLLKHISVKMLITYQTDRQAQCQKWHYAYIKLELEVCTIITEETTDYMDYLNPCNKNQTAKILERFFYVSNGREYISVIPDEAERITKLPTLDEVKKDTNRVVTYAKEIILNADKYKDMDIEESVLKQYACDIDPLLDKIRLR